MDKCNKKIYLFGGGFFIGNEGKMKVENGKFYFIKDEFFDIFLLKWKMYCFNNPFFVEKCVSTMKEIILCVSFN